MGLNLAFKPLLYSLRTNRGKMLFDNLRKKIGKDSVIDNLTIKSNQGAWAYLPWLGKLIHIPEEKHFWELRTSRNRDLINFSEQLRLKKARIGIAGLSVGNNAALALALEGFENFRLADFDNLELSNLNRMRSGIQNLGENKTLITARQIYEINPYAKLRLFSKGLNENVLKKFLVGSKKLDVLVEETDSLEIKIKIRLLARKLRVPVICATDNGDNVILDVERFDLEPKRPLYHGLVEEPVNFQALRSMDFNDRLSFINKIVGLKYITKSMKKSLDKIGKTLKTWPQLGGTAQLAGAVAAYAVRKICLKKKIKSGKYNIDLEGSLL